MSSSGGGVLLIGAVVAALLFVGLLGFALLVAGFVLYIRGGNTEPAQIGPIGSAPRSGPLGPPMEGNPDPTEETDANVPVTTPSPGRTSAPPAPPAYQAPPHSTPPSAFANPTDAAPAPFQDDFLRIFDDDELDEHAATEVFTREAAAKMLFEAGEEEAGSPPAAEDAKPLPGKVVATKLD